MLINGFSVVIAAVVCVVTVFITLIINGHLNLSLFNFSAYIQVYKMKNGG